MNAFARLQSACGLSDPDAAALLDVRADTIRSWRTGRRVAPTNAVATLAEFWAKVEDAADGARDEERRRHLEQDR